MPRFRSRLGQISTQVKAFVADRLSLAHARAAAGHALDLIFPPHGFDIAAEGSDQGLLQGDQNFLQGGMSAGAWSHIRFLADEGCDMCARPFDGGLHYGAGALCSHCAEKPFSFTRTRAACLYGDGSKAIILGFKHGDRLDMAPMLTRWLERAGAEILHEADILLPVPLHPLRLLRRRYNQAAELARPLARRTGCQYLPDALRRTRLTRQQAHSAEQRWANVRGAFAVSKTGARRIAGKHVVLVDDVFTTGATLRACADTLLKAGARQVDTLVLARAVAA